MNEKTVKELRDIAKELNISGRWDMTKQELIEAITAAQVSDRDITFETDCVAQEPQTDERDMDAVLKRLERAEPGVLVAFKRRSNEDVAMSGKLVSVDNAKGKVYIESKKGTLFEVKKSNVIWVKTGKYWPKGVHALFKKKEGGHDAVSKVEE